MSRGYGSESVIQSMAYRLCPVKNTVDSRSQDTEDYCQSLRLKALEAQKKPHSCDRERVWLNTVIKNTTITLFRAKVCEDKRRGGQLAPVKEVVADYGFESRMLRRDLFRKLSLRLDTSDWDLLCLFAYYGCDYTYTWKVFGEDVSKRGFHKRVASILEKAREILGNLDC